MKKLILITPVALALAACASTTAPVHDATLTASTQPLSCQAHVSVTRPIDFTTTVVHVRTQALVRVFTVAFYKTVDRAYFVRASSSGQAQVTYHISGATPGRKVEVVVTVVRRHHASSCSTSFTPRRRGSSSSPPAPSPSPSSSAPAPDPSTAACYPTTAAGNCYQAGEFCSDADHGMSGIAENGDAIVCENDNGWRWVAA